MTLNVVDFKSAQSKVDAEVKEHLLERIDELRKAVEEDRIEQVVIQYDEEPTSEVEDENVEVVTSLIFWNKEENLDQMIGYAERLKQRIVFTAETLTG